MAGLVQEETAPRPPSAHPSVETDSKEEKRHVTMDQKMMLDVTLPVQGFCLVIPAPSILRKNQLFVVLLIRVLLRDSNCVLMKQVLILLWD